jgi:endonuclease/exonuclease/phosphatase family metal-dependent hydrolase
MLVDMKLTTLNLNGQNNWRKREPFILKYLTAEDADIVFFQEVVYLPEESPYTPVSLLNRRLKYPYEQSIISRLQTSTQYKDYREGLSVLSKFPITTSETLVLKQDPHDHLQRIVQLIDVNYHGHIVKLANVHFAENPELAYDHLAELLEILKSRHERRIIIGDFNMPDLKHNQLWKNTYTASTSEYYISYPTNNDRIDYVLMPKSDILVDVSLSPDGLSDHRALTANIHLK